MENKDKAHTTHEKIVAKLEANLLKAEATVTQLRRLLRELKDLTDVYYSYSPVSVEREEEILKEVEEELKDES